MIAGRARRAGPGLGVLAALLIATVGAGAAPDQKQPWVKPRASPWVPRVFQPVTDVAEVEPNGGPAQAQAIGCGNALAPAAITDVAAVPDSDWISFTAGAGDLISFQTSADPPGGPETDTVIDILSSDGVTRLATNDDAGPTTSFSAILDFPAPYGGLYYGRIRGFQGSPLSQGPYRADLSCVSAPPVPENDQCAGALDLPAGTVDLAGDSRSAANDYDLCPGEQQCPASCTGFNSPGNDVVFRLQPTSDQDLIDVTYTLPAGADASIYIVTDCGDVPGTCVAGSDAEAEIPSEHLVYTFPGAGTYYLILDAFTSGGGRWTLTGCMSCSTPVRPSTWGGLKTLYR